MNSVPFPKFEQVALIQGIYGFSEIYQVYLAQELSWEPFLRIVLYWLMRWPAWSLNLICDYSLCYSEDKTLVNNPHAPDELKANFRHNTQCKISRLDLKYECKTIDRS